MKYDIQLTMNNNFFWVFIKFLMRPGFLAKASFSLLLILLVQEIWWGRGGPHSKENGRSNSHQNRWDHAISKIIRSGADLWTRDLEKAENVFYWWVWRKIHAQQWDNEIIKKICLATKKCSHQWSLKVHPKCWKWWRWWTERLFYGGQAGKF